MLQKNWKNYETDGYESSVIIFLQFEGENVLLNRHFWFMPMPIPKWGDDNNYIL